MVVDDVHNHAPHIRPVILPLSGHTRARRGIDHHLHIGIFFHAPEVEVYRELATVRQGHDSLRTAFASNGRPARDAATREALNERWARPRADSRSRAAAEETSEESAQEPAARLP